PALRDQTQSWSARVILPLAVNSRVPKPPQSYSTRFQGRFSPWEISPIQTGARKISRSAMTQLGDVTRLAPGPRRGTTSTVAAVHPLTRIISAPLLGVPTRPTTAT